MGLGRLLVRLSTAWHLGVIVGTHPGLMRDKHRETEQEKGSETVQTSPRHFHQSFLWKTCVTPPSLRLQPVFLPFRGSQCTGHGSGSVYKTVRPTWV